MGTFILPPRQTMVPSFPLGKYYTKDESDARFAPIGSGGSSPLTTKGDLFTYSTLNARLPVGADGYVLSANSGEATGLKWVPAGSGSISLTTTGTSGVATLIAGTLNVPNYTYTLPTASDTVLGGVKVDGTSITITGGVISATTGGSGTVTSVTSANGDLSIATQTSTPVITVVSAPKLTTARTINGTSFDGTGNITITAAAGTLTGTTLNSTVVTSSLTSVGTLGSLSVTGNITNAALTASKVAFTDASKNLTSTGIGTSAQFIKADGSLDSSTYLTTAVSSFNSRTGSVIPVAGDYASLTETYTNKDLTSGTNTFPTFNQNTTGSAAKWTTARNLAGNSVDGSANVSFANKFIVQGTSDAGLSGAQFLGALGTGILKNTTTTGVLTVAVAADFPTLNQNTTGSAATLTTPRAINGVNFDGSAAITVTAAAGTLTGTTLNSTVVSSSLTSLGTITTGVWNGTAIANANLANSSLTVGSTSIALGSTSTTFAGLTSVTSTSFVGALTGNASTATTLATGRTIAITGDLAYTSPSFDGSGNVTAAGTLATVNSNVGSFGTATQVATFTVNAKGLTTAASNVTITPAIGSITGLGTGVATFLATPSSANLISAVTDETGTGALVFATSPTLVTPALGTPSSCVGTNITGITAAHVVAGTFGTGAYTMDTSLTVPQLFNAVSTATVTANATTITRANRQNKVVNSSAAGLTITLSTSGAVDGDMLMITSFASSAVAQGITWVNTENSDVTPSANLNASTTLPRTDGFRYNGSTSKWRCIASC